MTRLLFFLGLLTVLTASANAQTLQNPSFEDADTDGHSAANWRQWGDKLGRETAWAPTHSGTAMMGYHHWEVTSPENSGFYQDVPGVKAGQSFTFSIWVSSDKVTTGNTASQVELRLEGTLNGSQVTLASVSTDVKDLAANEWHQLNVTGTTTTDNLRVLVIVTPTGEVPRRGALKFDDATLVPAQAATSATPATNAPPH